MTLTADDVAHLAVEVALGIPASESTLPDTPEVRETRDALAGDIAAIRARGLVPDVPMEWPSAPRAGG